MFGGYLTIQGAAEDGARNAYALWQAYSSLKQLDPNHELLRLMTIKEKPKGEILHPDLCPVSITWTYSREFVKRYETNRATESLEGIIGGVRDSITDYTKDLKAALKSGKKS